MENNIIEKVITGDLEMVQAAIAQKYQTIRQDDMTKLKLDIVTIGKFIDPIYLTPEYKIIDGWKRLKIIKELYKEDFKLTIEPTVIIIDGSERQEEIYISKNVMVNRYKKSWLAIIAAENNLPETRRIANARRGIKQEESYDACTAAGLAFGISGKLVQQAEFILNSEHGEFLRGKIRTEEMTVTNAFEVVSRELNIILNDMKNGRTYQQSKNDFMRDGQGFRQHEKFQKREEFRQENLLEYQKTELTSSVPEISATKIMEVIAEPLSVEVSQKTAKIVSLLHIETQSVSNQNKFFGVLDGYCSPKFKDELAKLLKKYMPNSKIAFVKDINKIQQLVHENNLNYTDIVKAA